MTPAELKLALEANWTDASSIGVLLNAISRYILEHGTDKDSLDVVVRLCERRDQILDVMPIGGEIVDSLCREVGLFTYTAKAEDLTWREQAVIECCRATGDPDFILHRDQKSAFEKLKDGENLILSAPTSFGKTALIDLLIDELRPNVVVYVVPTIALMDERRRRFSQRFGDGYRIITQQSQASSVGEATIFVQTQERLLDRDDIEKIDLLVVDEFYKLDPDRRDDRYLTLNAALYKFASISKQIVMLGPFVSGVRLSGRHGKRYKFFESHTSTVAVDVIDKIDSADPEAELANVLTEFSGESTLVYSRSPQSARNIVSSLIDRGIVRKSEEISEFADWLAESYHPKWSLVRALKAGFGLHHGQIPRAIGQVLVSLFNNGTLKTLICTSSLIEGVNTAAKNVIVFDKKIDRRNLDFFSFRNITGRSGRMGFHYVGRVFLFHEAPEPELFSVEIPVLNAPNKLTDELLVGLSDVDLDAASRVRKRGLLTHQDIPADVLEAHARLGISGLKATYLKIADDIADGFDGLIWKSPFPTFAELVASLSVGWSELEFSRGRFRSAKQAAFFAMRLGIAGGNVRVFLNALAEGKSDEDASEEIDLAFSAMRALEFSIPAVLAAVEDLTNIALGRLRREPVTYLNYIFALQNLFVDPTLKALDEYGIPIPFGQRLFGVHGAPMDLDAAIDAIRQMRDGQVLSRGVDQRSMVVLRSFV